jgi:hypothetical protein
MVAKILKANGQIVIYLTLQTMTDDEEISPMEDKARKDFDACIQLVLGDHYKPVDFDDDPDTETPLYDPYDNDKGNKEN